MEFKVTIQSKELSIEELQLLLQSIRSCERMLFPGKELFIWIDAPKLNREEAREILASITPGYKHVFDVGLPPQGDIGHG